MKTAFYRLPGTPGKGFFIDAESLTNKEAHKLRKTSQNLFCPNCGERVFYSSETKNIRPGEKWYHAPHFSHQNAEKCANDECDLRTDPTQAQGARYISQRLRTPLFLRPTSNGDFVLSVGFSSANKEALRYLQECKYKSILIKRGATELGEASFEEMMKEKAQDMVYVDLPYPIAKNNTISIELRNVFGDQMNEPLQISHNPEWSDTIDWFKDQNNGAIFQYSAGGAGEKIHSGGFVCAGRPYLIADKEADKNKFLPAGRLEQMAKKYNLPFEHKGWLRFEKTSLRYAVRKVVFPRCSDFESKAEYESFVNWLLERYAVQLCDDIPEMRPVWPPASRKCDAYAAIPLGRFNTEYILAENTSPDAVLQVHRTYSNIEDHTPYLYYGHTVYRVPLTNRRVPISVSEELMPVVSSFRMEDPQSILSQAIYLDMGGNTYELTSAGQYNYDAPEGTDVEVVITSACKFTAYTTTEGKTAKQIGNKVEAKLKKGQRILIMTETKAVYGLVFGETIHETTPVAATELQDWPESEMDTQEAVLSITPATSGKVIHFTGAARYCNRYNRYGRYMKKGS